jgi:UDP-glucose 4-epimerase
MTPLQKTESFKNKNILITGGLGFVGSNLALKLVELGAKVTLIDSMIPGCGGNLFNIKEIEDRVKLDFSDIRDQHSMSLLVRTADIIFNLAGQVSHADSMKDPYTDLEINAKGHLSILEACRKNNPKVKIVFASTRQVYGKPSYLPVTEKHPLNPSDINGINKMAGEWYHMLYNRVYGIRTICLRMTNTFGPRLLMKHKRQGFLGWFIRQVIDGKEIEIFGNGKQKRDPVYIDDVVEAFLICGGNDSANGETFNLGNVTPISLEDIVKLLVKINGSGKYCLVPFPEEVKKIDIGDYYASYVKFNKLTGWKPKISYEEGFRRTLCYYKENQRHYW